MQTNTYKGYSLVRSWNGYRVAEAGGAQWPENYATTADAYKSIDFELKGKKA